MPCSVFSLGSIGYLADITSDVKHNYTYAQLMHVSGNLFQSACDERLLCGQPIHVVMQMLSACQFMIDTPFLVVRTLQPTRCIILVWSSNASAGRCPA